MAKRRPGSASDPLWFKDAIIYELHVKAFCDSNADGIGDFQGLIHRLEYLQTLGVTCIWLLPFFPSPLRDDGYDIADSMSVHPGSRTTHDSTAFTAESPEPPPRVTIKQAITHSSAPTPSFQTTRTAAPDAP